MKKTVPLHRRHLPVLANSAYKDSTGSKRFIAIHFGFRLHKYNAIISFTLPAIEAKPDGLETEMVFLK